MGKKSSIAMIEMSTLDNGIRVATQSVAGFQGATVCINVESGATDETPELAGAAHFLEHMMFKGTHKRNAQAIFRAFDAIGAQTNACTSHESVHYYADCLYDTVPDTFGILADMVLNSTLPQAELDMERSVVLEEIKRAHDNNDSYLWQQFAAGFWYDSVIGLPVLGHADSIGSVAREALMAHKEAWYRPSLLTVTAAGNVDHAELVSLVSAEMGMLREDKPFARVAQPVPVCKGARRHNVRNLQQVQFYLGYQSLNQEHELYWAQRLLNTILGGGFSSRLYTEIREKRGLAYSVGTELIERRQDSALILYAGCSPEKAQEAIDICHHEAMRMAEELVDAEELTEAKRQLRGKILLSLDKNAVQAMRLASNLNRCGAPLTAASMLDHIDKVDAATIMAAAQLVFAAKPYLESIGPEVNCELPA